MRHLYFSLLSSGLSRPDKKINNQLNISIKHSVLTWQQILLHKLRVRLGVGEESIVRLVFVDQVLSEEDSGPGLTIEPYLDGVFVEEIDEREQCDDQANEEETSHADTD